MIRPGLPLWRLGAGALTGPHHRRAGQRSQDAFASWQINRRELVLLAVADGAGSLTRSGEGAQRAVQVALTVAGSALEDPTAGTDVDAATLDAALRSGVDAARADLTGDVDAAQLGATLALVAVGAHAWAGAVVGDSFVVLTDTTGAHQLLRPAPAGEYANITRLLTSADPAPLHACADEPLLAAFASSDGLAWATLSGEHPHQQPHPGFYTPLRTVADVDVTGLLEHMDAAGRIDDDSTIVFAARRDDPTGLV